MASSSNSRQVLLFIVVAFAILVLMLSFVGESIPPKTMQRSDLPYVLGFAAIAGSALMSLVKLRPLVGMPLPRFQRQMMICLGLAELGTLAGFVFHIQMGASIWPLAAGSEAVILLLILPVALAEMRSA